MKNIFVTKSFLPPKEEFDRYIEHIYETGQLTNSGQLLGKLEETLKTYLNVKYLQVVSNGTIAMQIAMNALSITEGEVITTPFSYVATTSAILWERCKPVFVDICTDNFTIDASKIEAAITPNTKAILAVHVFGYACNVDKIEKIASKHNLKVIYDAAHTFGAKYNGRSLLDYGDISTCSFHATKLFHTIEGGCVVTNNKEIHDKLDLIKRFGHNIDDYVCLGINAKMNEFSAAMGLCNMKYIAEIIKNRREISELYDNLLLDVLERPETDKNLEYNFAYYPVLFKSEEDLLKTFAALKVKNIFPRRYFYPSLNTLPYLEERIGCPISENICSRIACLPLFVGLEEENIKLIASTIKANIN